MPRDPIAFERAVIATPPPKRPTRPSRRNALCRIVRQFQPDAQVGVLTVLPRAVALALAAQHVVEILV
jgi:hypothetical protein